MREYTLLAIIFAAAIPVMDKIFRTGLMKNRLFFVFLAVIFFFKLLVNGYLTSRLIVIYNPEMFSGIRLGSIPLEDFLFGFSMVGFCLIVWEKTQNR
ncbi:MAG: lycopene cyclase domain-containing protein [Candidatus Omnitrophota bacterium]|jgi:lycopene cyclase domain-containing protein